MQTDKKFTNNEKQQVVDQLIIIHGAEGDYQHSYGGGDFAGRI